jgi:hypothetical protein
MDSDSDFEPDYGDDTLVGVVVTSKKHGKETRAKRRRSQRSRAGKVGTASSSSSSNSGVPVILPADSGSNDFSTDSEGQGKEEAMMKPVAKKRAKPQSSSTLSQLWGKFNNKTQDQPGPAIGSNSVEAAWNCGKCTFEHAGKERSSYLACELCGTERPDYSHGVRSASYGFDPFQFQVYDYMFDPCC